MGARLCGVVGVVAGLVSPAVGQTAPPLVAFDVVVADGIPGIPAPLGGRKGDAKEGEKVVIERREGNCLSCHEVTALKSEEFHGEIGPSLDGVAGRWDAARLRMIMVDAKKVFGSETA